jgi:hypothetical protein
MDAKCTSFVGHIAADAATHASENANVESDISILLHIVVYLMLIFKSAVI